MPFAPLSKAINIFFSYATTASPDISFFDQLMTHVSALQHMHLIDQCYDSAIDPGGDTSQLIESYLNAVDIIVLLISSDFIASQRCYDLEMKRALERAETDEIQLIPVILRPLYWKNLPFSKYHPLPPEGKPVSSWNNVDDALSQIVEGIHHAIQKITDRIQPQPPKPSQSSLLSIPYRRNPFFTDRERIFATLSSSFRPKEGTILALSGLGGIGKTQIALEYCYLSLPKYQSVLWLNASSPETFSTEVSRLAERLALPGTTRMNEQQIFEAVKHWLADHSEWLLVLDALNDLSLLNLLVPPQHYGHILLTTPIQATGEMTAISIMQMDSQDSLLFFLKRAKLLPPQTSISQVPPEIALTASTLIQKLDGFPLALDQAASYLEETGCSLSTYLDLYEQQQHRTSLLNIRGQIGDTSHSESMLITLSLAFEQVTKLPAHLDLLYLLAFLEPDTIPERLLTLGASELDEPLQTLASHPLDLHKALSQFLHFSLIQRSSDSTLLRIHRLVQNVLIDQLSADQQLQWANTVIHMLNLVFPTGYFETWHECELYLPQAQHCSILIDRFHLTSPESAQLLQRLGSYLYRRGHYHEAKHYLTQSLQLYEIQAEGDAANAAQTLNILGLLSHRQALYQKAEDYHERALALRERTFGPTHPKTAESLHNLALLYSKLEKYSQAEQLYLRVLSLDELSQETDRSETAHTLNSLALVYYRSGKYSEAEEAYQKALTIYEQTSPDHPDLTYPVIGLGSIAERRGNYPEAETHYLRALTLREKNLGTQHPETAHSLNKLADIYEAQNKDEQAEVLYQRALTISERSMGPNHPDVALLLNNLASLATKHGHYSQAEALYQRSLSIYEQSLGPESREAATLLNNQGKLYQKMGNLERAEALFRHALSIRQQALGQDHPDTAQILKNLTSLLDT